VNAVRQYFYLFSGLVAGVTPILVAVHTITQDQAVSISGLLQNVAGLIGAAAAATAGVVVSRQRKDGTLDVPPPPADQVISGVQAVIDAKNSAQNDFARVQGALTDLVGTTPFVDTIPDLGQLTREVINMHRPY
jgi:hypothetical protein